MAEKKIILKLKEKWQSGANFGILYGMTGKNFAERFDMTLEEGEEFVETFKSKLPTLFTWTRRIEQIAAKYGTVSTMLGRPRRVRFWMNSTNWNDVSFGKRTAVNTIIQGTGADILKYVMIKLFNEIYQQPEMTKLIRFKSTIHDEINYQIKKEYIRPICKKILKIMNCKLRPDWEFAMKTGLEIGNRWGQSVGFDFDLNTFEILHPSYEYYEPHEEIKVEESTEPEVNLEEYEVNYDL